MGHYISMMRPGRPDLQGSMTAEDRDVFGRHVDYLKDQFAAGAIVFAGPSVEENEEHFAIVVLSADSKGKAKAIMDGDPAVAAGLLTSHVTEFEVFLSREVET
jgi:uncharacterized protein YciI